MVHNLDPEKIEELSIADILSLVNFLSENLKILKNKSEQYSGGTGTIVNELYIKIKSHKFRIRKLQQEISVRISLIFPD